MSMKIMTWLSKGSGHAVTGGRGMTAGLVGAFLIASTHVHGQQAAARQEGKGLRIDDTRRAAIIDAVVANVEEHYVFPEVGKKICEHLRQQQEGGAYARITSLQGLTERLMMDMQRSSNDKHIGVLVLDERSRELIRESGGEADEASWAAYIAEARRTNFGFERVERLGGNVGYMKLTRLESPRAAGETAIGAMNFLANCDALILDVRGCPGGRDEMVQLLLSYFFEDQVHFATKIHRQRDNGQQRWTLPYVPGKKLLGVPLYVLVDEWTASGGEALAYFLKHHLEGTTIIGQTTAGAAHMTHGHPVSDLKIIVFIPDGATVSPVTETDWEGTGVKPDIQVPADEALQVAHIEALKILLEGETSEHWRFEKEWLLKRLKAEQNPIRLSETESKAYTGAYGPRRVTLEGGQLFYARQGGRRSRLIPMGDDLFMVDGLDYFRIQFVRDGSRRVTELTGLYDNGKTDSNKRTGR
jgi:hypothetical protein